MLKSLASVGSVSEAPAVMRLLWIAILVLAGGRLCGTEITPVHKLDVKDRDARLVSDVKTALLLRKGLLDVIAYMDSRPDLFPASKVKQTRLLRREEKEVVWNTWKRFADYLTALSAAEEYHRNFYRLKGAAREESFLIGDAAMLAGHRAALDFIIRTERNPELDKVLNDAVPELGLPQNCYAKLKFKHLNIAIATEYAARAVTLKTFSGGRLPELRAAIREDMQVVWKSGGGRKDALPVKNAFKIVQNGGQAAWLPIQTGVSEWMGDTKVYRAGRSLISEEQIAGLQKKLLPGDVLLERRDWYLSNVGLPGFWPHAALYVGTADERRAFFDDDAVRTWLAGQGGAADFEDYLKTRFGRAHELSEVGQEHGHLPRVIEAMSEGVCFTTLEHSASCDSLAVLRPRLSKLERAQAIARAFHYSGRPYDFNFDFSTDAALVCTELVYKSYEPSGEMKGLQFPLIEMLGRKVTPANELVKQFDAQYGTPEQQYELVAFLDGVERKKKAAEATLEAFRVSWKRPKWHVLMAK